MQAKLTVKSMNMTLDICSYFVDGLLNITIVRDSFCELQTIRGKYKRPDDGDVQIHRLVMSLG